MQARSIDAGSIRCHRSRPRRLGCAKPRCRTADSKPELFAWWRKKDDSPLRVSPCGPVACRDRSRSLRALVEPLSVRTLLGLTPCQPDVCVVVTCVDIQMVEGGGFEPPKAEPTDLQSVPFDRLGIPPREPRIVVNPDTVVNREFVSRPRVAGTPRPRISPTQQAPGAHALGRVASSRY